MTNLHPAIAAALAPFAPRSSSHINDDDLYVIEIRSKKIVQNLGRTRAPHPVSPGQALMTGLNAKLAGVL